MGLREGARPGPEQAVREGQDAQWNGETDLPWETDVDQEPVVIANANADMDGQGTDIDLTGTSTRLGRGATRSG